MFFSRVTNTANEQPWNEIGGNEVGMDCQKGKQFYLDSIAFAVHTRKTAFSNSTIFKLFHSGERFRNDPFSVIVFNVVVWTVVVSGTKQYLSFSFENGVVWTRFWYKRLSPSSFHASKLQI